MARFTERWLNLQPRDDEESTLHVDDVVLIADPREGGELLAGLGNELRRNYLDPAALINLLQSLGADSLASHLRQHQFPTTVRNRHADFGEAVSSGVFRHLRRYCVPVLKLRFKHSPNQPIQGADVIAFRFTNDSRVVAMPEVKTRSRRDRAMARDALASMNAILSSRLGEGISFAANHMARVNPTLASRIALLLDEREVRVERHIVLVTDADVWREDVLDVIRPDVGENTTATVVHIPDLAALVDIAFTAAEQLPPAGSQ